MTKSLKTVSNIDIEAEFKNQGNTMVWFVSILVIILILFVVFSLSRSAKRSKEAVRSAEAIAITSEKSLAYTDYLKRTSQDQKITSLTDNELNEYVARKVRSYNKEISDVKGASHVLFGLVAIGTLVLAAGDLFFGAIVGVVAIFLSVKFRNSRFSKIDSEYRKQGLDPERLLVETSS